MLLCAAAMCPVFLWDALKITHRIAGPVVRFKDVLKRLTNGEEVARMDLREGDLMMDLQDAFNEYLASLQTASQNPPEKEMASSRDLYNILEVLTDDLDSTESVEVYHEDSG